jgi:hypothetical protein
MTAIDIAEFRRLTLEERIGKCQVMAAEAESSAAVNPDKRDWYLELAADWSELAEETEIALIKRSHQGRTAAL